MFVAKVFELGQHSYSYLRMISIVLNILPYVYMQYLLRISSAKRLG